jgi:hypothetical protein
MSLIGAGKISIGGFTRGVVDRFVDPDARRARFYKRKLANVRDASSPKDVFETIYRDNLWDSAESRSGPGSEMTYTAPLRAALADWMRRHAGEVTTFFDAPSGDLNWIRHVPMPAGWRYVGGDIVAPLVAENAQRFGPEGRTFRVHDIANDAIPDDVDAWLCRDVLFHLPFEMGVKAIARFRASKAKYFLSTTFPYMAVNATDIEIGHYRDVNLAVAPYGLGEPVELLPDDPDPNPVRFVGVWRNPGR